MSGLALELVTAPALIITHRDDACPITRPEDSVSLKHRFTASPRVGLLAFSGGSTPVSNACDPLAPHGFFGIDQTVVTIIGKWIRNE
jgi:hypothetical protein